MDKPEYMFQILEVFSKVRSKEIPRELEEYISYVARTGDPVFQWSLVKVLIKEKLLAVLGEFIENGGPVDVPPCPNVDLFDYDSMKEHVFKQLDAFVYPPFTIQRICELLAAPRKEYNRVDKYMRAIEKNVLVVSASDLSMKRALDSDANDSVINGILYDKVNDSLTTYTNHVFAAASGDEHEDELVAAKMDETDAVQRIIDESWNEEAPASDDFKLNGSGASFEQELRQFEGAEKGSDEVDDPKTEPSSSASSSSDENAVETSSSSSFDENSAATQPQPSLQCIPSTSISFENVADAKEEDETSQTSPEPANDTYEFKDDSLEGASVCPAELDDLAPIDEDVAESSEATPVDVVDDSGHEDRPEFVDSQSEEPSTTTLEMMAVASTDCTTAIEPMVVESFDNAAEAQPESTSAEVADSAECSFGEVEDDYTPSVRTDTNDSDWISYSAGDFQSDADQPEGEEPQENDGGSKVVPEEPSQPSLAEADAKPETTTVEMETSQSAE